MHEYEKSAAKSVQQNHEVTAQAKTNGIPNSALQDVLSGKAHATSQMMGHSQNLAPSIAAKMSQAFGMNLSGMQVYRSDAMVGSGMEGMASGNKVVLSSDVDLNTKAGQAVLGHEISHIHAQSQGIGMGNSGLYENAALEHQADTEGLMAAQGKSIYSDGAMDMGIGMQYGLGMQGVENITSLSGGMSASAGAPMQAKKGGEKSKKEAAALPKMAATMESNAPAASNKNADEFNPADYDSPDKKDALLRRWGIYGGVHKVFFGSGKEEKRLNEVAESSVAMDEALVNGTDTDENGREERVNASMGEVQSRKFYKSLSQPERLAMLEYTSEAYKDYNSYKRGNNNEQGLKTSKLEEKTSSLDSALKKYETPYAFTVWRAVGKEAFEKFSLGGKKTLDDDLKGTVITDKGYMSTSTKKSVCTGWSDAGVILEIDIPKGARVGAPIGTMSANMGDEREFLLSPGTSLEILGEKDSLAGTGNNKDKQIKTLHCHVVGASSSGKEA